MKHSNPTLQIGPLSPASSGPLYRQIVEGVRREVSEGRLEGESPLPSFRALAEQLMVSLITVKRAYEELEREGIIYRRQGLGTFVADQGGARSREGKRRRAEGLLAEAAREAREAGISTDEFITLARQATAGREGANHEH